MDDEPEEASAGPILHVLVIGFHHKRGCQVDFAYPVLAKDGDESENETVSVSHELPEEWKHLPFLALPDGAHNFLEDTVYFHLPGREKSNKTVYGISCYKQIDSRDLLRKSADITRGTVLKSVCVLSTLPLYGLIQAKVQLVTKVYFAEKDFSKTKILQELFSDLNTCLSSEALETSQAFLGLSARELVTLFRHKVLVLFKLLLLERRVLMYMTPVRDLSTTMLSLLSLLPGMVERGLDESAAYSHVKHDAELELSSFGINTDEYVDVQYSHLPNYKHINYTLKETSAPAPPTSRTSESTSTLPISSEEIEETTATRKKEISSSHLAKEETAGVVSAAPIEDELLNLIDKELNNDTAREPVNVAAPGEKAAAAAQPCAQPSEHRATASTSLPAEQQLDRSKASPPPVQEIEREAGDDDDGQFENIEGSISPTPLSIQTDGFGFPLALFSKGSLCHPYLSLQQHEILQDVKVRSFFIGATNILYKQRKELLDVIIDVDENKITISDNELKKQLSLSTADLRFADLIVKSVAEGSVENNAGWEGSEEWLRAQFKLYLLSLMSTIENSEESGQEGQDFNAQFIKAWKTTHNFRIWKSHQHNAVSTIDNRHPCSGQVGVADMKLRVKNIMQNTDQGRKLTSAMNRTGVAMGSMAGALNNAKSTMVSWFSQLANSSNDT